jgi:hypothetical protein
MSQFGQSRSAMNDAIGEDVDREFSGVNQRLQLNQLQEGEVRESLNGRMEGYWRPRRGIVEKTGALTTGQAPLALPFYLMDTPKTITAASYSAGVVTITIASHGFQAGSTGWAVVSGLTFTGTNNNGPKLLTRTGADTLTFTVTGVTAVSGTGTLSTMPINDAANANVRASCLFSDPNTGNKEFIIVALDTLAKKIDLETFAVTDIAYPVGQALGKDTEIIQLFDKVMLFRDGMQALEWYPNGRPVLAAAQNGTTVSVNVRNHGLTVGASIIISNLTGTAPPNGTFTVASIVDESQFTYTVVGSTTETFVVSTATMTDGFTYSPGGDYTQPQVFNVTGLDIKALDGLVTIEVENNLTISAGDPIIVYEVTIPEFTPILNKTFQVTSASLSEIQFYAPVPNYTRNVVSASQTGTSVTMVVRGHGFSISDSITVAGLTGVNGGTMPNGTQTVTSVTGDEFTYTAAAALPYYAIVTPLAITAVSVASEVVTITINSHGFGGNGWANVSGLDVALNGNKSLTRVNSNQLSFPAPGVTSVTIQNGLLSQMTYNLTTTVATAEKPTRSAQQIEAGGRFSVGGGFMHQPGAPWGIYFQRRLWVPYYYDQSGAYNAVTYTNRKITDEIAVSDILDTTTFDQIENQFRISGGTADYVVGMHGFYDDALVVLNRNSLHIVKGTQGSLLDTSVRELTSEIGCLARKSVVMRGNAMMFLSDDGVYAVEFLNDYNLRGADEPISKNIQPYIDRINKDYADRAVGVLFDNRYYLAVPLDSVAGANDARGNNAILVFNFLNKGWESLDTFGDSRFLIKNFVLGSASARNNIYAVTANGGVHQLEAVDSSADRLNVSNAGTPVVTPTINSSLTTRGYDLGTMERKRFTDAQVVMQNLAGETGEYMISFAAEDPDDASEIGTTTQFLGGQVLSPSTAGEAETAGIRCRLGGIRGYTGTMVLTRTIGSPKINSIKVAGSVTNRQIISQR